MLYLKQIHKNFLNSTKYIIIFLKIVGPGWCKSDDHQIWSVFYLKIVSN